MNIYLAGLGIRGSGYPNAARTIALLERANPGKVVRCGGWLPENIRLWRLTTIPRWQAFAWVAKLVFGNLHSLLRVCVHLRRQNGVAYIPYPAVFFLAVLTILPRRWRPRVIVDGYISIWDSMFRDRVCRQSDSFISKCVKRFESIALRSASMVLVDTEASRRMFIADLGIDGDAIRSLPLAIEEEFFLRERSSNSLTRNRLSRSDDVGRIRVLFVGTLIPLHGIDTILGAFEKLVDDERFDLCLIGDGQEAGKVEAFLAAKSAQNRVRWVRDWLSLEQIAVELTDADICLGVFGGAGKAARVLPFKIYMYMAAGKAIVTQSDYSLPEGCPELPVMHADSVAALVKKIMSLAENDKARAELGEASAAYYLQWLSNVRVVDEWKDILAHFERD